MKFRIQIQIVSVLLVLLTGCVAERAQPDDKSILGYWRSGPTETELGESILEVTFTNTEEVEFKLIPVAGGQSVASKGRYRLDGKNLIADVFNKGEPVLIWLERGELLIQTPTEKLQRFSRVR